MFILKFVVYNEANLILYWNSYMFFFQLFKLEEMLDVGKGTREVITTSDASATATS